MNPPSLAEQYARWLRAVNCASRKGWQCVKGWTFCAPSGSLHDLSAADLNQLARIERDNLFAV